MLAVEHPSRDQSIAMIARAFDAATAKGIPVVIVRHELPAEAPVFAVGSAEHALHSEVEQRADQAVSDHGKSRSAIT